VSLFRRDRGRAAEDAAARHLERRRHVILARNFRSRAGEIDLVTRDRETIVFVEVRSRGGGGFGSGSESVDARKQRRLARAAEAYLARHRLGESRARFDVISIDWIDGAPKIEHIEDAFQTTD
jgi:putative endonuclease